MEQLFTLLVFRHADPCLMLYITPLIERNEGIKDTQSGFSILDTIKIRHTLVEIWETTWLLASNFLNCINWVYQVCSLHHQWWILHESWLHILGHLQIWGHHHIWGHLLIWVCPPIRVLLSIWGCLYSWGRLHDIGCSHI